MNLGDVLWTNAQTREIFVHVALKRLTDDPREWVEADNRKAVDLLAREVRREMYREFYVAMSDYPAAAALMRAGLRTIDWKEIAKELLRAYLPKKSSAAA